MDPRNLQWSKYFPNPLEYASKVVYGSDSPPVKRKRKKDQPYNPVQQKSRSVQVDIPPISYQSSQSVQVNLITPDVAKSTISTQTKIFKPPTEISQKNQRVQVGLIEQSSQSVQVNLSVAKSNISTQTKDTLKRNQSEQVNLSTIDDCMIFMTKSTIGTQTTDDTDDDTEKTHIVPIPGPVEIKPKIEEKPTTKAPPEYPPPESDETSPSSPSVPVDDLPHEASSTWDEMLGIGEPRVVVSVIGAYDDRHSKFNSRDRSLLTYALRNLARQAGRCGFLYRNGDFSFMQSVTDVSCLLESFDGITYGYTATDAMGNKNTNQVSQLSQQKTNQYQYHQHLLNIEKFINRKGKILFQSGHREKIRVPVALFVTNGDLYTLEHVVRALYNDISIVIVKGSGGVADLIALCMESMKNMRKISLLLTTRFSKQLYEEVEAVIKLILERDWMITVFDLQNNHTDNLWDRVSDGILQAWSYEDIKASEGTPIRLLLNEDRIFSDHGVSISKYVVDIDLLAKTEIFGGLRLQTVGDDNINMNILVSALLGQHTDILRAMLNSKKFHIKPPQLAALYQKTLTFKRHNGQDNINIILQKIEPNAYEALETETTHPIEAVAKIAEKLLKGLCFSKIGMVTCCGAMCRSRGRSTEIEQTFQSVDDILRFYVFTNDIQNAGELWIHSKHPMLTALISSCYLASLAEKAEEMFNDSLHENLIEHSKRFSKRAEILLDKLYNIDNNMATYALDYVTEIWGHLESPLHFGQHFNMEEFISHTSAQKDASKRLYAFVHGPDTKQNKKEIPDFYNTNPTNIAGEHVHSDEEFSVKAFFKTHRKNPWKIITAPISKLCVHAIMFMAALIMFSIFLTTDLVPEYISVLELLVYIFLLGEIVEEIWSMVRPRDGVWSPQRIVIHLLNVWNILDISSFVLFLFAFTMHLFDDENDSVILHIRRLYSICLFVMFLRLLNLLLLTKRFGIIIIMVKEMLKDLFEYLVILVILICGAGVVYQANIYPNHPLSAFTSQVWSILKIPYWQVYGELYLDTLEGSVDTDCTSNATEWENDIKERCPVGDWITPVIAAFYMMLTNWLLLNIVIAMFSSRFDYIKEKSKQKWRYYRHAVIITYEHWIPSPFNLIWRPVSIIYHTIMLPCSGCQCLVGPPKGNIEKSMLQKQKELAKTIIDEENATASSITSPQIKSF